MRGKDREVTDINEILEIIDRCKVCRVGMKDDNDVYIVPLNFGYKYEDDTLVLYFHSASSGKKIELLKSNPNVFIEMSIENGFVNSTEAHACECTFKFESVMGKGKAIFIEDIEEKKQGFGILMNHFMSGEHVFHEGMLKATTVFKVVLSEYSCKVNR